MVSAIGAAASVADGTVEGTGPDEGRTERTIALVRTAVVAVVAVVYVSSIGLERRLGPLAVSILALASIYTLWTVVARPYETAVGLRFRTASLLADVALISLWTRGTGGPESEFWTLYLIAVIAVALRFDLLETMGAALGIALVLRDEHVRRGWTHDVVADRATFAHGDHGLRRGRARAAAASARGAAARARADRRGAVTGARGGAGGGGAPDRARRRQDEVRRRRVA
jgi:hypothetical protein